MLLKVSFQPHIGKSVAAQSREKFRHLPEAGGFLSVRLILNTFLPSDCSRASPPLFSASATTSVLLFSSSSQRTDTSFRAPLLFKPLILHAWLQRGYQHGEGGKSSKLSPIYVRRRMEEVNDSYKSVLQMEEKLLPYCLVYTAVILSDSSYLFL